MALLLSSPPITPNSPPKLIHNTLLRSSSSSSPHSTAIPRGRRFLCLPPLRVAAPPSPTTTSPEDQEQSAPDELSEPVIEVEDEDESSTSKFSWRDHWYPVSLVEDLDPRLPTPFQLLNRDLVLWFDRSKSEWVAFDDQCPHRLAPLSEGRIDEDGNLQCSYHGWSFDGCGSCAKIPQASSEGPEARAVRSPRACATRFPTMVSQGLLFVWPDENGRERASATKPPLLPEDFDKPEFSTVTIQRDLFYGYDTLMENVSDPSHIDFAHHKVTGRRDRAKPLPFKMESTGHWGFAGSNDGNPKISAEFVAPCYYINKIEIDTKLPVVGDQKWVIWICSFNVPMAPGKTRSIVCSARNFFQLTMPGPAWWQVVPRWHEHWTSNKVYDGDMIVLQGQEKIFLSKSMEESTDVNKEYTKITFTPTQADRFVLAFRNWLRRHGNSQPEWFGITKNQPLPSTVLSKRQMLDRFEQHTLKCSSCKRAYTAFQTSQKILIAAAVICSATAGIPSGSPTTQITEEKEVSSKSSLPVTNPNPPKAGIPRKRTRSGRTVTYTSSALESMAAAKETKTKKKKVQVQGSKPGVSQQISESLNILKSITENLSEDEDSPSTESPKDPTTNLIQTGSQVELSPLSTNKGPSIPPKSEQPPVPRNTISTGSSSLPSTHISRDIVSKLSILDRVEQLLARSAQTQSPSSSASLLPSDDEISRAKKLLLKIIDNKPDVILFSSSEILAAIQVLQQNPSFSLAQQSLISEFQSKFVSLSNAYHSTNQVIADVIQFLEKKDRTMKELQEESSIYKELLSIKGDVMGEMDKLSVRAALLEKELADIRSSLQTLKTKHEELNSKDQLLGSQIEEKTKVFEEQLNIVSKNEEERNRATAEGLRIESSLPSVLVLLKDLLI